MEERKANWSEASINLLVDLVADAERWAIIRGKFGPSLTIQTKQRAWFEITERVNSCFSCVRSVKDVKKKWQDIQSHTKKKAANRKSEMKKTGGGSPPPELKPWEEKIVAVLSNDIISGVEGGYESLSVISPMDDCIQECSKKRKYDEPLEGCDAPSIDINKPLQSVGEDVSEIMSTCTNGDRPINKKKKKDVENFTVSAVKDRLLEIEEEKLKIMKEHLAIEKKKDEHP
ncbi:uncharacterized protein LOC133195107 [Saccostrea echinata]|uniref:uncharacterized protein LOC133195107 n=1 Tax=Saccostrea echinata TaxID=191078 RepID=UPI002A8040DA|nr:uncharacterized protein LOC133195107 [Saccostrea echinata]